jgi:hypothetical protein
MLPIGITGYISATSTLPSPRSGSRLDKHWKKWPFAEKSRFHHIMAKIFLTF